MRGFKVLFTLMAAVALFGAASTAHAVCIPELFAGSVQGATPFNYTYITMGNATGDSTNFNMRMFQTNNFANSNGSGTGWLYNPYVGEGPDGYWYVYGFVGVETAPNCPQGNPLTVYAEAPADEGDTFFMWTVPDAIGASGEFRYDFADNVATGFFAAVSSPRPRATSSSRAGSTVTVNYSVNNPASGVSTSGGGSVTGVTVYTQNSATQPSLDVAGWTSIQSLGATGGSGSHGCDCSNTAVDCWLAAGFSIDSQPVNFVSFPTQVECDPTLADPKREFKVLDREPRGRIKPR